MTVMPFLVMAAALNGAFVTPPAGPAEPLLDELLASGLTTIVLTETRLGDGACDALTFPWGKGWPEKLPAFTAAAKRRGMQLWLAGPKLSSACALQMRKPPSAPMRAAWREIVATGEALGVAGYYVPDEPDAASLLATVPYVAALRTEIRSLSTRPVMIAPYSAGSLAKGADAAAFARATGINVQVWQDGVGVRAASGLGTVLEDARQTFDVVAKALPPGGFGTVTELFAAGRLERFDTALAYHAGPIERLRAQLAIIAKNAEPRLAWLPQKHMTALTGDEGAATLLAGYRALTQHGGRLVPTTLKFAQQPDDRYASLGKTLADPSDPHRGWAGWTGTATVTATLDKPASLRRVGVHLLNEPAWGIRAPVRVEITCGRRIFRCDVATDEQATEYVAATADMGGVRCDVLKIHLSSDSWVFFGGVMVVAD